MAAVKIKNKNKFDMLAQSFIHSKNAERTAVEERRASAEALLTLPEVLEHKREKGSVSFESENHRVEVKYVVSESFDHAKLAEELSENALKSIFILKREFSQSGLNAYLKRLDSEGIVDAAAAQEAKTIRAAMEKYTTAKPGATQVIVSSIE